MFRKEHKHQLRLEHSFFLWTITVPGWVFKIWDFNALKLIKFSLFFFFKYACSKSYACFS